MPALSAAQINTGAKRNVRDIPHPNPPVGRWRCVLCPWPRWVDGTYDDWQQHYTTEHQQEGGDGGG